MPHQRGADRRVRRTRTRLHDALACLVHEKPYADIVVKEILGRADVARSTFYEHYRDKDELLECGIRDLLRIDSHPPDRWTRPTDRLLSFSLPFLTHVEGWREDGRLPLTATAAAMIHEHLRRVLQASLADTLRAERRRQPATDDGAIAVELLARYVANTFLLVLDWWLEHPHDSARDVDARFRALVVPTLRAAIGD